MAGWECPRCGLFLTEHEDACECGVARDRSAAPVSVDAWTLAGLTQILRGKEFRHLIEHHIRAGTNMRDAAEAMVIGFSPRQASIVEHVIDRWSKQASTGPFWREDAADVLLSITADATEGFQAADVVANERLLVWTFHAFVISLAWSAAEDRSLRRFAGIKKAWWDLA